MPEVNPKILQWARETAGLSLEEAAGKIQLKDGKKKTGAQKLQELERGEENPSHSQLDRMARSYHQPLLVFYLDQPPQRGDRGADFRTVQETGRPRDRINLDFLLRDIKAKQGLLKSVLEDAEDAVPLRFIGSEKMSSGVDKVAQGIARTIGFDLREFREQKSREHAFQYLRTKIEEAGVFVMLEGNLGSYHTNIPAEIFRGFALADPIAPLIVINPQDSHSAWSFTALHELAHLWLGETGVSASLPNAKRQGTEAFCNRVAAEMLLPRAELQELGQWETGEPLEKIAERIASFAQKRNISRSMAAYALQRNNVIGYPTWDKLHQYFRHQWLESQKKKKDQKSAGGPNYYTVKVSRLGETLLRLVDRSIHERLLSYTKAAIILGVAPRSVPKLLRR